MTRIFASVSPVALPRRALAATALTALALAGCGTERPGDGGSPSKPGSGVSAKASATPTSSEQRAAMLSWLRQGCPSTGGTETGLGPSDRRPTGPVGAGKQTLAPGETPPAEPIEPVLPSGPVTELSDRDWCASARHEQRIIQVLQAVPEPTPAKVRKILNDLGYIDERIHDLRQDGRRTRFLLDLRAKGGRLCEEGVAAGLLTDVSPCVARAAGPFTVTSRGE